GLTYDTVESGVQLVAQSSSGDSLDDGLSALFNVTATPSTLTVTNLGDSGPGSLRDAITTLNGGGCSAPCTIEFDVNGTGNIVLASPLPAIMNPVTIDGYSGIGSQPNTTSFGQPVDSVITVSLDGNNAVAFGLIVQAANTTIKGIGFRRFNVAGSGEAIKIDNVPGCTIAGNYIGTDNTGSVAQPNFYGIVLNGAGATLNTIGGDNPADRNLITANASWGINVTGGATLNEIAGNYIGLRNDGISTLANGNGGILICSVCNDNSIGSAIVGNAISGHDPGAGIQIDGVMTDVIGNRIGTSANGGSALPNATGIVLNGDDNYVGGIGPGDRNLISGNSGDGIVINSNDNEISKNWIGTNFSGTVALANGSHGILVTGTAANNEIGLPLGNRIAFNTQEGIQLSTTGVGNIIRTNEIYSNGALAIDLGADGATANDPSDPDLGPNNRQNFPTISAAEINGANLDVTVSLDSSLGVNANFFVIDLYQADASSPSQASSHLGASGCLAGVLVNQVISVPVGVATVGGKIVAAATAFSDAGCTTASEGSSELSPSAIVAGDVHWIAGSGGWETAANWSTGFLPGTNDRAIIDAPGTYTVTLTSGQSIKSLTVGSGISGVQSLTVAGGPLTLSSASTITNTGVLNLNQTIQGGGTLTNNGQINWNNGTFALAGVTNNTVGTAMTIGTASAKTLI
ncbi:MAG TPA: hypothetical protein VF215_01570, partial [Thermoanaerobaculia bacterium]